MSRSAEQADVVRNFTIVQASEPICTKRVSTIYSEARFQGDQKQEGAPGNGQGKKRQRESENFELSFRHIMGARKSYHISHTVTVMQ